MTQNGNAGKRVVLIGSGNVAWHFRITSYNVCYTKLLRGSIPVIECLLHYTTLITALANGGVVFSNITGVVAITAQHHGVRLFPGLFGNAGSRIEIHAMLTFELAQQNGNPAWGANGTGNMGLGKLNAFSGQLIDMRRLDTFIAFATQ